MKKFAIALAVVAMITFGATISMANGCPSCDEPEVKAANLEITGGALVGVQGYTGGSTSTSHTSTCLTDTTSSSALEILGAGFSTSANGIVCVSATNPGLVSGNGAFASNLNFSGAYMVNDLNLHLDFGTSSAVNVYGGNGCTP